VELTKQPESFQDYLQLYLDILGYQQSSPRTIQGYGAEIRNFFRFLEERGTDNLNTVARKELDDYQTFLYYYRNNRGQSLSAETQGIKLCILRSFFRTLVQAGYLLFNPTQDIDLPRQRARLPRNLLSSKEIGKILNAPDINTVYGYRDRTVMEVFYSTGIRPMELAALTLDDLDLEERFLRILEGKGLKDRTVPLTTVASGYLREYIAGVRPLLVKPSSGRILFLTRSGKAFDRSAIHKKLQSYAKRIGIDRKKITARAFRCTLATEMLRGRADIRQIQEILGHRHLSTTQIYTHVIKDDLKKVHQKTHPREQLESNEDICYRGDNRLE
jgi:integrase/recombinase XerD